MTETGGTILPRGVQVAGQLVPRSGKQRAGPAASPQSGKRVCRRRQATPQTKRTVKSGGALATYEDYNEEDNEEEEDDDEQEEEEEKHVRTRQERASRPHANQCTYTRRLSSIRTSSPQAVQGWSGVD